MEYYGVLWVLDRWKYSQGLPEATYYWGVQRSTIKGLNSGQVWLVDELLRTAVDWIYSNSEYNYANWLADTKI